MCGANIVADDLAIRSEFVTCTYCSTVLRITLQGTQEYRDSIPHREAPPGVVVERKGSGNLSITVQRTPQLSVLNKEAVLPAILIGSAIGIALSGVVTVPTLLIGIAQNAWFFILTAIGLLAVSIIISVFVTQIVMAAIMSRMNKNLSPLRLENSIIHSSFKRESIIGKNVEQFYAAVATGAFPTIGVFALTKDGRRIRLIWPLISKEAALYVEEILEVELGIFNLPVYGDPDIPGQKRDVVPESPAPASVEGIQCEGCAARLHETPEETRQGYVVCRYCNGMTLIYEPGTSKPILGLPEPNSPAFRYRLAETHTGLEVSDRDTKTVMLEITEGELHLYHGQKRDHTLSMSDLANICVKARTIESPAEPTTALGGLKNLWSFTKAMDEAGKYSGEVDPLEVMMQIGGRKTFRIVARNTRGDEIGLLEDIKDPREAFVLMKSLSKMRSQTDRQANVG
jgi:hypothetical protein